MFVAVGFVLPPPIRVQPPTVVRSTLDEPVERIAWCVDRGLDDERSVADCRDDLGQHLVGVAVEGELGQVSPCKLKRAGTPAASGCKRTEAGTGVGEHGVLCAVYLQLPLQQPRQLG